MKIVVVSSSTRPGRTSHRVALSLTSRIHHTEGFTAELLDLKENPLPFFSEVIHKLENPDPAIISTAQSLEAADAIIFVSPEYNGSYAPALKNMADMMGKPAFNKKPIGVASVTTGALGGIRAAVAMQQLVLGVGAYPIPQMLTVPTVMDKINAEGEVTDPQFDTKLQNFVNDFLWFVGKIRG